MLHSHDENVFSLKREPILKYQVHLIVTFGGLATFFFHAYESQESGQPHFCSLLEKKQASHAIFPIPKQRVDFHGK